MDRRAFIGAVALSLLAMPLAAEAQRVWIGQRDATRLLPVLVPPDEGKDNAGKVPPSLT